MDAVLLVGMMCAVSMVAVGASSAAANEYGVFARCPAESAEVASCIVVRTESGEIKLGRLSVPIEKIQTLQGGLVLVNEFDSQFVAALGGETLTRAAQKVPGGLTGVRCSDIEGGGPIGAWLRRLCEKTLESSLANVYATTELAGPASSIVLNEPFLEIGYGTALTLPVKVKLENPLLGNSCYIGSNTEPIDLELTSGAPGKLGTISVKAKGGILALSDDTLVDSAFKAPAATGCGIGGRLDRSLNAKLGLPASTGNDAILNNTLEEANAELVTANGA